jgi:benzoate-CoA ligase
MAGLSKTDHSVSPPAIEIPRRYNAAHDLIERNLVAGRGAKLAYIDDAGRCTYAELAERVNRAANALAGLGLGFEDRVMLCHLYTIDWPAVFLGAIKAGIVPIAVNTLLTAADYEFMLNDSRAKALVVSEALWPQFASILAGCPHVKHVIVSGTHAQGRLRLQDRSAGARRSRRRRRAAMTRASGCTRRARPARPRVRSTSSRA